MPFYDSMINPPYYFIWFMSYSFAPRKAFFLESAVTSITLGIKEKGQMGDISIGNILKFQIIGIKGKL